MENENNRIVQSLYLCTTNSREKMQQSIVENILYSLDTPLERQEIIDFIKSEFHLEIDNFELDETLKRLITENNIKENDKKYSLTDNAKQNVYKNVLANKEIENNRIDRIQKIVNSFNCQINDFEVKQVVDSFNEYLYNCFLEYGRNAIKFFLPFSKDEQIDGNILKQTLVKFNNVDQKKAFTSLVAIYPERIDSNELEYLENLAIKAEYFFSLGIPEETFNKAQDFKLNGLVILVDTNFLYSILGLHSHRQNENCNQIVKLISDNKIDCRLVFIKKTLEELRNKKNDFDRTITYEELTYNQIKSLLDSEKLNNFSREYFERKIIDPETPHPSERVKHSQKILTSKRIQIYNYSFPHLDDTKYLNAKFEDYYDYINIKNEARVKIGLNEKSPKDDRKLEHDIYLREAVISLRKEKNSINDFNYLCLTLDRGLIDFDRFANGRNFKGKEDIAPNFILPSLFLRKIRPFIPLITDDYKKAFLTSITANTIETSLPQYSEAVQRTMSYFKKLGIDDYDLIVSIIKQELFFKEFVEIKDTEEQEQFIRSEIDKAYEKLKQEKEAATEELKIAELQRIKDLESERSKIDQLKVSIKESNTIFAQEKSRFSEELEESKKEKDSIEFKKSSDEIDYTRKLLDEKKSVLTEMSKQKIPIERIAEKDWVRYKFWYSLLVICYFIALVIITVRVGWAVMEPYTYFFGLSGIVASYLYAAISGKSVDPRKHFEIVHNDLKEKRLKEFGFDNIKFEQLLNEVKNLEDELGTLKTAHNTRYS